MELCSPARSKRLGSDDHASHVAFGSTDGGINLTMGRRVGEIVGGFVSWTFELNGVVTLDDICEPDRELG